MAELAFSYASILKSEQQDDGTLKVYGKATDDSIDIDNQICDETWLQNAMPAWFETGGNIREQHSNIAAGVATDYELKSDGHYITAHVVDPSSVKKVQAGVLKGFSIGIRSPRIIRDNKAANGRIVDGQIVEISLVDRPANPNAKLMLAKAADGGELLAVKQVSIPSPADLVNKFNENHDEAGRFASGDGGSSTAGADTHATLDGVTSTTNGDSRAKSDKQETDRSALPENQRPAYDVARIDGLNHSEALNVARGSTSQATNVREYADRRTLSGNGMRVYDNMRSNMGYTHAQAMRAGQTPGSFDKDADADLAKFNENHDEQGRFSSGDGGGSGAHDKASQAIAGLREHIASKSNLAPAVKQDIKGHLKAANDSVERSLRYHASGDHLNAGIALQQAANSALRAEQLAQNVPTQFTGSGVHGAEYSYDNANNVTPSDIGSQAINAALSEYTTSPNKSSDADLAKFNENHDEQGRFASGDGASSNNAELPQKTSNQMASVISNAATFENENPKTEEALIPARQALDNADYAHSEGRFSEAAGHLANAASLATAVAASDSGASNTAAKIQDAAKQYSELLSGANKSADLGEPDTKVETMTNETEKSVEGDLVKFDQNLYDTALKAITGLIGVEADEAAAGSDEADSIHHLLKAIEHLKEWYEGEVKEGEVPGESNGDLIELAAETKCDKCDMVEKDCKCADKSATPELAVEGVIADTIIEKAVQTAKQAVEAELESLKSVAATAESKVVELEAQLSDALSKAAAGGPARSGIKTKSVNVDDLLVKAAEYRNKASVATDRVLADGYRELADDLEKKARKGRK